EHVEKVVGRDGKESDATFATFDYIIPDNKEDLEGSVTYMVPGVFDTPQFHTVKVVINNDVDAVKAELVAAIKVVNEVASPSEELKAALTAANAANKYTVKQVDMQAALTALNTALLTNPVAAIVHYVNSGDLSKLSSMATYLKNNKLYTKEGVNYLRV